MHEGADLADQPGGQQARRQGEHKAREDHQPHEILDRFSHGPAFSFPFRTGFHVLPSVTFTTIPSKTSTVSPLAGGSP
jgi:hypothetical protein